MNSPQNFRDFQFPLILVHKLLQRHNIFQKFHCIENGSCISHLLYLATMILQSKIEYFFLMS